MRLKLETRAEPSRLMAYLSPLLAAGLTIVAGFILFSALGKNPVEAFYTFFIHPIRDLNGIAELLLKASPLMLIAVGLACGYRANVWNIGAEGQLILGAIFAGGVALYFYGSDNKLVLPAMVLAGAVGGMLWASIPAFLRSRFNTNEILVSLMLVYVANLLLSWLVHEPWRDPEGLNFPQSKQFTESALYPSASARSYYARGAGGNLTWIDPQSDIVAVLRWTDPAAMDEFMKLTMAALQG